MLMHLEYLTRNQPNASNGIISFSMGYLENISLLKKYLKYLVKYLILLACQF